VEVTLQGRLCAAARPEQPVRRSVPPRPDALPSFDRVVAVAALPPERPVQPGRSAHATGPLPSFTGDRILAD